MNQNDQMREALRLSEAVIKSWIPVSYNREKINERAKALESIKKALSHVNETPKNEHDSADVLKPAKLVLLTLSQKLEAIELAQREVLPETINRHHALKVANAIMDAMQEKNK